MTVQPAGSVPITLTNDEREAAIRQAAAWLGIHERGRADIFKPRTDKERLRVNAAGAQAAVAKYLGGRLPNVKAKHTPNPSGALPIRPSDRDDHAYVLVTGTKDEFRVIGWAWGHERERGQWRSDVPYPAHFIAQDQLRSPASLVDLCAIGTAYARQALGLDRGSITDQRRSALRGPA